jgi:YidC/Oxa1 family membrane protein insertase
MDRNSLLRTLVIAMVLLGGYWFLFGRKSGSEHLQSLPPEHYVSTPGFVPDVKVDGEPPPASPVPVTECTIKGVRFVAELSSHGAGLTHFRYTDAAYNVPPKKDEGDARDLTTPDVERWRNLRTLFRDPSGVDSPDDQVKFDRFDWKTEPLPEPQPACRFTYEDPTVRIVKTVSADGRPFELEVDTTITNLTDAPKKHTTSVEIFAYWQNKYVKGKLGRVSPFQTNLECARGGDVKRLNKGADEFKTGWFSEPLVDRYAAITNYYFSQALVPLEAAPGVGGDKPACELGDEQWYGPGEAPDDAEAGDVYKARLTYPKRILGPNESATYKQIAYFGPKERDVLAVAAGGWPHLQDLINLGTFSFVAKFLVSVIRWIHTNITMGNWGLAIIVLTLGLRTVLFPLTWKQIQSAVAMRRLKPEIDVLNAKFKDDAQAKNVAMMELWRKHKVNPLGGCLPALVQMPIWFALYATLQTAVEFYHTKFLWFADLSAPDPFYVLPLVLGAAMIMQQRIVPQQGMDPVQAKMMMWLMPGVFTVMMLFLPAALGVYMLTNSLLGITQQLVTEKLYPRAPAAKGDDIVVKSAGGSGGSKKNKDKGPATAAALGKGKARV